MWWIMARQMYFPEILEDVSFNLKVKQFELTENNTLAINHGQ